MLVLKWLRYQNKIETHSKLSYYFVATILINFVILMILTSLHISRGKHPQLRALCLRLTDWEHGPPLKITDHDFKNFFKLW